MTTTRNDGAAVQHVIGERGELVLRLHSGRLEVTATGGDTVFVRDLDGRDLADRFELERADGRLVVRPRERVMFDFALGGRRGRGSARLAVDVPRHASVSLDTANGAIEAQGLRGEQRYRTASGEISVADASGPIAVDAVSGTARIVASGTVELSGRLVSGDLTVRGGALQSVALASTSGDIELDAPLGGAGPFSIETVSGDARVAATGNLRVVARTLTGDVESELEHRSESGRGRRELVIGSGTPVLAFKSISGDLLVAAAAGPHLFGDRTAGAGHVESTAAPVPPAPPAPPDAPGPMSHRPPAGDDPRLAVLRDLEAGAIDVETATRRLADLEDRTDA